MYFRIVSHVYESVISIVEHIGGLWILVHWPSDSVGIESFLHWLKRVQTDVRSVNSKNYCILHNLILETLLIDSLNQSGYEFIINVVQINMLTFHHRPTFKIVVIYHYHQSITQCYLPNLCINPIQQTLYFRFLNWFYHQSLFSSQISWWYQKYQYSYISERSVTYPTVSNTVLYKIMLMYISPSEQPSYIYSLCLCYWLAHWLFLCPCPCHWLWW